MVIRRYTFKLYPTKQQFERMHDLRRLHCNLYNGLLEHRQMAWRMGRKSVSFFDQSKELTALRRDMPEWRSLYRSCMEMTAKRVDAAYQKFFANIKAKQSGKSKDRFSEPRFKPSKFFPGWGYKAHIKGGWTMFPTDSGKHGRVRLADISGTVKYRGKFPASLDALDLRTCEVIWRDNEWWLSVAVKMESRRKKGRKNIEIKLDLVDKFAEFSIIEGRCDAPTSGFSETVSSNSSQGKAENAFRFLPSRSDLQNGGKTQNECYSYNDSHFEEETPVGDFAGVSCSDPHFEEETQVESERDLTNKCCNDPNFEEETQVHIASNNGALSYGDPHFEGETQGINRERGRGAKPRRRKEIRAVRRRKAAMHVLTKQIAEDAKSITITRPKSFKDITKSGKGNKRRWGAMVKTKARLNRHILDQLPAAFVETLKYKIAESGGEFHEIIDDTPVAEIGNTLVSAAVKIRITRAKIRRAA